MKKYDILVYIGRFQPVHNAHAAIIAQAAKLADKLIIIVGSANEPRTFKNPWSSQEREAMLSDVWNMLPYGHNCTIAIEHNINTIYNDQEWVKRIQNIVSKHKNGANKIGIIGHKKDGSSYYLDMFPQWELESVGLIEPLNATHIRDLFFKVDFNINFLKGVMPYYTLNYLTCWKKQYVAEFEQVIAERKYIADYKRQFEGLKYPPVFVTVDAVVLCSGHVLMVKRRAEPGKGLWALPGGFINADTDSSLQSAMIRELREETGIKVPVPVLIGSIQDRKVFDAVNRSARGRTITQAFKIVLPDGELPKVKGADDAEKAQWIPLADVDSSVSFEDHFEIINYFT
jgi:bifunctional NMN adenylyltransferase/nudix hydrolase